MCEFGKTESTCAQIVVADMRICRQMKEKTYVLVHSRLVVLE